MPKYKILVGRFPYGGSEASECVDWLIGTSIRISQDSRFELFRTKLNDTPITMTRNRMFREALRAGMDYLLIVDSDMAPDIELGADPRARPFWESSIEFLLAQPKPCVIAAPYCGPPPVENVYVFQWATHEGDHPNPDGHIDQYTREQAAVMGGIQEVAALPTGLMLMDLRVLKAIPEPYTYYEWKDAGPRCPTCHQSESGPQAEKASTEDCTFTRDLSFAGVKLYCNWDAWAGHVKRKVVGKPRITTADSVARRFHDAIQRGQLTGEQVVEVRGGRFDKDIEKALAEAGPPANRSRPLVCSSTSPVFAPIPLTPADLFRPGEDAP